VDEDHEVEDEQNFENKDGDAECFADGTERGEPGHERVERVR
jgi:hypothetical protein